MVVQNGDEAHGIESVKKKQLNLNPRKNSHWSEPYPRETNMTIKTSTTIWRCMDPIAN